MEIKRKKCWSLLFVTNKTFSTKPHENEKQKLIICPICKEDRFKSFWECDGFRFVQCRKCSLILQNPQPVPEALAARYSDSYFSYEQANETLFFNLMESSFHDIGFIDIEKQFKEGEDRTFLDIGCATGRLLRSLKERKWDVAGVEVCRESAEFGNREYGVNISPTTLEDAHFEDSRFSVIHSSHLIEHLPDPVIFLNEVDRILKPGGYLITTTPSATGLQAKLFKNNWRSAIADHVILYTPQTLDSLYMTKGFIRKKVKTWGGIGKGYAPGWIKRPIDILAKKWGFGDVMVMVHQKTI